MRKLIICDKNKALIESLKKAFKEVPNKTGIEIELVCGDIIALHEKTPNSRIVTASNPEFSPDGGLDAVLAKKYGWHKPTEFVWNDDLFFVKSVNSDRKATKEIIKRALVGVFAYLPKYTMLLTGIGTGIGGLAVEVWARALIDIFSSANLSSADLRYAVLSSADLRSADLRYADLSSANLSSANLLKVVHDECTAFLALSCPSEGAFIGWKKAGDCIVKLQITDKAKRSSATSRKCRCSEAKVLAIYDGKKTKKKVKSDYDQTVVYEVGKIVKPKEKFNENRWDECSSGIHFFLTREEAELWTN